MRKLILYPFGLWIVRSAKVRDSMAPVMAIASRIKRNAAPITEPRRTAHHWRLVRGMGGSEGQSIAFQCLFTPRLDFPVSLRSDKSVVPDRDHRGHFADRPDRNPRHRFWRRASPHHISW